MNYFNYFTEIEDAFVRRRGKHVYLSPLDWALIESWKEKGVPLHIALSGIERAFDSHDAKPHRRSVKSLMYCQEEVEAQFAEWHEAQVGASAIDESGNGREQQQLSEPDAQLPFPRASIMDHLTRAREALQSVCDARRAKHEDSLCETLSRVIKRLDALMKDFQKSARPDAERLESALTDLEKMIDESLLASFKPAELKKIKAATAEQLEPYRKRMEQSAYEQTFNNLLMKRLRESENVPRLSLFYL